MSKQKLPDDITKMSHPFSNKAEVKSSVHYITSQAIVEMLDKKCDMENLLRLSVKRKMKDYIKTLCNIPDVNAEFKKWVKLKARMTSLLRIGG